MKVSASRGKRVTVQVVTGALFVMGLACKSERRPAPEDSSLGRRNGNDKVATAVKPVDPQEEDLWLSRLNGNDEVEKRVAAGKLGEMQSPGAVPDLLRLLVTPSLQGEASKALARIGSPAVPELVKLLSDGYPPFRRVA